MASHHHDLVVVGTGSGNMVVDSSFADLDVAFVEEEHRFGGTCLNVGCIPTKMLAHTADVATEVRSAGTFDVAAEPGGVDWPAVRDRVFARLDPIATDSRRSRADTDSITVHTGTAGFTGPRELDVDGVTVTGDRIVLAVGSRPVVPPPVADSGLPYETSNTIMRLDALPARLVVLGGGYIAAELAHVFDSFGTDVTIVESGDTLLASLDGQLASAFTELAARRFTLHLGRQLTELRGRPGDLEIVLDDGTVIGADTLLVATGRTPNGDRMDLAKGGVETDDAGLITVDEYQRTTSDGVWALGDCCSPVPLKHVANREADVVRHNLRHPESLRSAQHDVVPAAVFTDPQIATVGATAAELSGRDYLRGTAEYVDTAYGWALEDPAGFCTVYVDPASGRLLGAHLLGPDAPVLIQPLVVAMTLGIPAADLIDRPYWIHPALTEVVQQALLDL
ncbi:mycothione reductase [Pseudonocardia oroxyli]|uniref:Mycothione reductase n=1 Tax=Pseudonocardia oroxyli TaxID=366584 RepID=A0A1G7WKR9_PSEOR|nr:mycothione reductase [Pseudonocardia oroxyli]SDG72448.1 mycothione reductase [Pseudonocardia oroxyli]